MDADVWQTIGAIAGFLALGAFNAWRTHRAERRALEASVHAAKAVEQTESTGNGWAGVVSERLERIEDLAIKTNDLMTEHLADHAGSDLNRRST